MSFLRRFLCVTVGHTWDRIFRRGPFGQSETVGWQCHHCGKWSTERPNGLLDRHFE